MSTTRRYLRTLRHLQRQQIGWRLVHEVRKRLYARAPRLTGWLARSFANTRLQLPSLSPPAIPPELRARAERWRAGHVEYLALRGDRGDWLALDKPKLWRYELHYHSELPALALMAMNEPSGEWRRDAQELIESWVKANPPGTADAWDSYPVARRIINWALAATIDPQLAQALERPLSTHVRFLAAHLERHLGGNHLLTDGIALLVGCALLNPEPATVRRAAASLLHEELARQLLADGGYAERTAQYHTLVLRDLLLAIAFHRAAGRPLPSAFAQAAERMAQWLQIVARRDGVLPWINDSAPDATPPVGEVLGLASALKLAPGPACGWLAQLFSGQTVAAEWTLRSGDLSLPQTGWSIVREEDHELLFDYGPIGPDEQPGHGHADTLGFELIWGGREIVVDSGISTYEICPQRQAERSAPAHATVTVDGEGADEPWASFRVGGRARITASSFQRRGPMRHLQAWLQSWRDWWLERTLHYWPGAALLVADRVTGAKGDVRSYVPLAPGVQLVDGELRAAGVSLRFLVLRGRLLEVANGTVGQGFGRLVPRSTLVLAADANGGCAYALVAPTVTVTESAGRVQLARGDEAFACQID